MSAHVQELQDLILAAAKGVGALRGAALGLSAPPLPMPKAAASLHEAADALDHAIQTYLATIETRQTIAKASHDPHKYQTRTPRH